MYIIGGIAEASTGLWGVLVWDAPCVGRAECWRLSSLAEPGTMLSRFVGNSCPTVALRTRGGTLLFVSAATHTTDG